ncbi:M20 metallopeptidase family protein [Virgibacillus kimchii]
MRKKTFKALTAQAVEDRRYFHRYPELSWEEFETATFIKKRLQKLHIEILDYPLPHVVGYIEGAEGNQTIALRADMDALPVKEEGDKPYQSNKPGISHACGHDGHMAVLLGVAEWLVQHHDQISPNIVLLFQPSEETEPSGAADLVEKGALDDVDAVYGLHLWQGLEKGKIGLAHGPMMASSDEFEITIQGSGGHGSTPHTTVDPIYISSHMIQALQAIVSRNTDPNETKVISVGSIEAGKTYNIIPDTVTMKGTVRAFSLETVHYIEKRIREVTEGICSTFHATGKVNYIKGTPPLINHEEESGRVEHAVQQAFGNDTFEEMKPIMGAEDFANYLLHKPGAFAFVGMDGEKSRYPHHHSRFDIDEEVLPHAMKLMIQIVKDYQ